MYATFNFISLPALSEGIRAFSLKSYVYGRAFSKAFSFAIAPHLHKIGKGFLHYSLTGLSTLEQQELASVQLQYNPVRAALNAAWTELTSEEAIACYRQIQSVAQERFTDARERLMDVAIIGLCGVVAISMGIDMAKDTYCKAATLYRKVHGCFNPTASSPTILLTVELAIATKSDAEIEVIAHQLQQERQTIAQFDSAEVSALTQVQVLVDDAIAKLKIVQLKDARAALVLGVESDRQAQAALKYIVEKAIEFAQEQALFSPNGSRDYVPVIADEIWNPQPTDMHEAVLEMAQQVNPAMTLDVPGAVVEKKSRSRSGSKPNASRRRSRKEASK